MNGRIAPARAPWLAYVSETAAVRDLIATDSTAADRENSAWARLNAVWAAATAATTIAPRENVPGIRIPKRGAGSTPTAKSRHLVWLRVTEFSICSVAESHVRPTSSEAAKRRAPTLIAADASDCVSRAASAATDAESTAMSGQMR